MSNNTPHTKPTYRTRFVAVVALLAALAAAGGTVHQPEQVQLGGDYQPRCC